MGAQGLIIVALRWAFRPAILTDGRNDLLTRKRILLLGCLTVLAALAIAGIVGVAAINRISMNLGPILERRLSAAIDRRVSIGSIALVWGNPIHLQATDLRLANALWGNDPDMIAVQGLSADIDVWPLLRGLVRYQNLRLDAPRIVLERNDEGIGNWHFTASEEPSLPSTLLASLVPWAIIPKDRTQFPTLIDFAVKDGLVSYRTSSGNRLRIALNALAIRTDGDGRPVIMTVDGRYNDMPVHLSAETESFSVMRKRAQPFGTHLSMATTSGTIGFDGTMTDPLNVDGIDGVLHIDGKDIGGLLAIFGAGVDLHLSLHVDSPFDHHGDRWQLADAKGTLGGDTFHGTFALDEGPRHEADRIALKLDFATLDLKRLIEAARTDSGTEPLSLRIDTKPPTVFDVGVTANEARYGKAKLTNLAAAGHLHPGEMALDQASFTAAAGTVKASGTARSVGAASRIETRMAVTGADSAEIAQWFGPAADPSEVVPLGGRLDARLSLEMTGTTLDEALERGQGQTVVSMTQGQVAKSWLEKASTNLRALFRKGEGTVPLTCFIGIGDLRDGIVTLTPVRLRTPDTTLVAGGNIDLRAERVDMTLRSADRKKSLLTLNLPLHIGGPLSSPRVSPLGTKPQPPDLAMDRLRPDMRQLAESNPCLR